MKRITSIEELRKEIDANSNKKMEYTDKNKAKSCLIKIKQNNACIVKLSRDNDRLLKSLAEYTFKISEEDAKRYDEELKSDKWKQYSTTIGKSK